MPGSDTQPNQRCLEWLQREATGRESQDRVPLYVLHVEEDSLTCGPFSANRTPTCTGCTHCLPAAVEGLIVYCHSNI